MPWAGSPKQRDIDHVEPAQNAVDDRPENRVVVGIGDRDGERRAKTHAVFRALDPNPVVSISVHGDPCVLSEVIPPSPVALRRTSHSAVIASQRVGAERRPMTGSTKQSIAPSKERMDCFVARAPRNDGGELCIQFSDLSKDVNPRSRGAIRPRLAFISRPRKQRAQGMPGAQCTRSLACEIKSTRA